MMPLSLQDGVCNLHTYAPPTIITYNEGGVWKINNLKEETSILQMDSVPKIEVIAKNCNKN